MQGCASPSSNFPPSSSSFVVNKSDQVHFFYLDPTIIIEIDGMDLKPFKVRWVTFSMLYQAKSVHTYETSSLNALIPDLGP